MTESRGTAFVVVVTPKEARCAPYLRQGDTDTWGPGDLQVLDRYPEEMTLRHALRSHPRVQVAGGLDKIDCHVVGEFDPTDLPNAIPRKVSEALGVTWASLQEGMLKLVADQQVIVATVAEDHVQVTKLALSMDGAQRDLQEGARRPFDWVAALAQKLAEDPRHGLDSSPTEETQAKLHKALKEAMADAHTARSAGFNTTLRVPGRQLQLRPKVTGEELWATMREVLETVLADDWAKIATGLTVLVDGEATPVTALVELLREKGATEVFFAPRDAFVKGASLVLAPPRLAMPPVPRASEPEAPAPAARARQAEPATPPRGAAILEDHATTPTPSGAPSAARPGEQPTSRTARPAPSTLAGFPPKPTRAQPASPVVEGSTALLTLVQFGVKDVAHLTLDTSGKATNLPARLVVHTDGRNGASVGFVIHWQPGETSVSVAVNVRQDVRAWKAGPKRDGEASLSAAVRDLNAFPAKGRAGTEYAMLRVSRQGRSVILQLLEPFETPTFTLEAP